MLPYVIGAVLGLVLGAALVYVFGVLRERKQADEDLNSAKNQAKQIVNDAYKSAENKKREALCLLYTSPSPRDRQKSRMPSSA